MYRLFTVITLVSLLWSSSAYAQTCCANHDGNFDALAVNAKFISEHLDPLPLNYTPQKGNMVSFETLDGKTGNAFYVPADQPTSNVLLIFHEWWGLNDYIKREAERWQGMLENVDVYAVDLYDGRVAADQQTASKLSSGLDKKRAENIIKGMLTAVGQNKRIVTLGWCMGGSWSFTAARLAGSQSAGTVMYYGFPEKDKKKIAELKSDVLYIWASKDDNISKAVVDEFGKQVEATGNDFTMHAFSAVHAFANPSNPKYDHDAAKKAEDLTLAFLREKLQLE